MSGTTGEWSWSDFRALSEITNSALKTAVNETLNSAKAYTDQKLVQPSVAFVRGMIMMWSGAANQIPSGWALCNGQNGTPPLQDRFIVGAGGSYAVGAHAGVKDQSVTLTLNNMPRHNHTGTTNNNTQTSGEASSILQPMNTDGFPNGSSDTGDGTNGHEHCQQAYWRGHKTTAVLTSAPLHAHTHNFTTNNAGSGLPFTFDNRPPYYALCFIMKL